MALWSQVSLKCVIYAFMYIYIYIRTYLQDRLLFYCSENTVAISLLQVKYC